MVCVFVCEHGEVGRLVCCTLCAIIVVEFDQFSTLTSVDPTVFSCLSPLQLQLEPLLVGWWQP